MRGQYEAIDLYLFGLVLSVPFVGMLLAGVIHENTALAVIGGVLSLPMFLATGYGAARGVGVIAVAAASSVGKHIPGFSVRGETE